MFKSGCATVVQCQCNAYLPKQHSVLLTLEMYNVQNSSTMPTSLQLIAVYVASSRSWDALSIFRDTVAVTPLALLCVPISSSCIAGRDEGHIGIVVSVFPHLLSATYKAAKNVHII